jgi:hypothetical protein
MATISTRYIGLDDRVAKDSSGDTPADRGIPQPTWWRSTEHQQVVAEVVLVLFGFVTSLVADASHSNTANSFQVEAQTRRVPPTTCTRTST